MIRSDVGASSEKKTVFTAGAYFRAAHGDYVNVFPIEIGGAFRCTITGRINEIPSFPANRISAYTITFPGSNVYGNITSACGVDIESNVLATDIPLGADRIYIYCNASTATEEPNQLSDEVQQELRKYVEDIIDSIFAAADDQTFEDGMESTFSRQLVSAIEKYGDLAMAEVNYLVTYGKLNNEVAGEALRWLARIKEPSTYAWRLWLLEKSLDSGSSFIRDSAALGLATMGASHAIPYMKTAIQKETISELRCDLTRVLLKLEASTDALPIEANKEA